MSPTRKRSLFPRRIVIVLLVLAALGAAWWFWKGRAGSGEQRFRTAQVEQGDIRVAISATGTLGALSTVDVGSEVSGKLAEVLVDYNDRVSKGQVIARIDPDTFEAQIAQGDAAIASARANLLTAQAALRNTELDYGRKASLVKQKLVARGDLDQAQAARDQARAQVAAAQAQIRQQQASSRNFRLNLARTVIRSPVDGVVLQRLNLIGCLDTPTSGTYLCDGVDVATLDAEERAILRRDKIGFVFQGFNLLSRMSALDNVSMPLSYARVAPAERRRLAAEALTAVGLGERMQHRPSELSGGQQQRVAIARALIHRPAILMADEPTGALDSRTGQEILALFERLRGEGHTIILITHDADVAAHADRTCVMRDGELHALETAA